MQRFVRRGKRTWDLVDATGKVLGTKSQPKWYSQRAEITVANGLYEVKGRKALSRDLAVFYGDVEVMHSKEKWTSTAIHRSNEPMPLIVLKRKSWFSPIHHLVDATGTVRASMRRRFHWEGFVHSIELLEAHGEPLEPLLLLFAAHVIEVQQHRAAAAAT